MVVLDTHALLWWALDPDRLSPAAASCLRDMDRDGGFASAISIWELGIKIQRGKLDLGLPIDEFARRIEGSAIELLPVNPRRGSGASSSHGTIAIRPTASSSRPPSCKASRWSPPTRRSTASAG